jgi:hypothetical protein
MIGNYTYLAPPAQPVPFNRAQINIRFRLAPDETLTRDYALQLFGTGESVPLARAEAYRLALDARDYFAFSKGAGPWTLHVRWRLSEILRRAIAAYERDVVHLLGALARSLTGNGPIGSFGVNLSIFLDASQEPGFATAIIAVTHLDQDGKRFLCDWDYEDEATNPEGFLRHRNPSLPQPWLDYLDGEINPRFGAKMINLASDLQASLTAEL